MQQSSPDAGNEAAALKTADQGWSASATCGNGGTRWAVCCRYSWISEVKRFSSWFSFAIPKSELRLACGSGLLDAANSIAVLMPVNRDC